MHQRRQGIAVVIRNDKGEILLMQRGPSARTETGHWENAGGEIEPNEEAESAAAREIQEELGVDVQITRLLYSDEFPPDSKNVIWSIHVFEGKIHEQPQIKEPEKCSAINWFSIEQLSTVPLTTYTRADFVRFGWLQN